MGSSSSASFSRQSSSAGCFAFPSGLCISDRHQACKVNRSAREEAVRFLQTVQADKARSAREEALRNTREEAPEDSPPTGALALLGRNLLREETEDKRQQQAEDDDILELQAFLEFLDEVRGVELPMPIRLPSLQALLDAP